jgi:hypothetical protein
MKALGRRAPGEHTERRNAAGSWIAALGIAERTNASARSPGLASSTYRRATSENTSRAFVRAWPARQRSWRRELAM